MVDPFSAGIIIASKVVETGVQATLEAVRIAGETAIDASKEIAVKSVETISDVIESTVKDSLETIDNISLESLKVQNEITVENINVEKIKQIAENRENGANREEFAQIELQHEYPEELGYKIEREQYLRDINANIVKDPESGEARRIDFTVSKDGQVVKSIEVTSETAPKDSQIAKENRIRNESGNFIKDRETGQLLEIPKKIQTEVRRYT